MKIEDEGEDSDDNDDSKKSEVVQLDPVPEEKEEQIEDAEKVEEMVQKEELKVEENANEEPTRCLILKWPLSTIGQRTFLDGGTFFIIKTKERKLKDLYVWMFK